MVSPNASVYHVDLLDDIDGPTIRWTVPAPESWTVLDDRPSRWAIRGNELADVALPDRPPDDSSEGKESLRERFLDAYRVARDRGSGVRLRILAEGSDLEDQPWELLRIDDAPTDLAHDPDWNPHVALSPRVAVVRSDGSEIPSGRLFEGGTLNVLLMAVGRGARLPFAPGADGVPADPEVCRLPSVELEATLVSARDRFETHRTRWRRLVDSPPDPSARTIRQTLRAFETHAVISIGHGVVLDEANRVVTGTGALPQGARAVILMKPEDGGRHAPRQGVAVPVTQLVEDNDTPPRLWVMAHCYLARQARHFLAAGRRTRDGQEERGGAVLAMQTLLLEEAGRRLIVDLCGRLAEHGTLEALVGWLRREMAAYAVQDGPSVLPAWYAPVLHLNAIDGSIG